MMVSVLCSSSEHPVFPELEKWARQQSHKHQIQLVNEVGDLVGGDLLFLISCNELVKPEVREIYKHVLVIHASPLPEGRGWSPHVWQVLEGKDTIPVTLLEAGDRVDSGAIWAQDAFRLEGHELHDEINDKLFAVTLELMNYALDHASEIKPYPQRVGEASYYRRRTAVDSELDPHRSIAEQFELLRVADPERYPCFFEYRGKRYKLSLAKIESSSNLENEN